MRTTLDIEDDVLIAAKELARQQNISIGKIISHLIRDALTGKPSMEDRTASSVGGFRPFPSRGHVVANEIVNTLRDEEGI